MNLRVEGDAWEYRTDMLYSPKDNMIFVEESLPNGEVHMFIHVEHFPEIEVVLFRSSYRAVFLNTGAYEVRETTLSKQNEDIIRNLLKVPEEYYAVTDSMNTVLERRGILREAYISELKECFPYDIAEHMFDTGICKNLGCFNVQACDPLSVHDFYILDESITDERRRLSRATCKSKVHEYERHFVGIELDYSECDGGCGPSTWCTLYDDTHVGVSISTTY